MTEKDVTAEIMLVLSQRGCRVFKKVTGLLYSKGKDGKYTPYSLKPKGHSDLYGHRPDGKAFYIEVKKPNHRTNKSHLQEQQNFLDQMKATGALAGFAESAEQAIKIVEG